MGVRYSALPAHTQELADALNEVLSAKWRDLRGLEIVSLGVNSVTASKEDEDMIKELQKTAVFRNPNMAGAALVGAQAEAMKSAAKNDAGAMTGFMGLGFAQQAGGANAEQLFRQGQQGDLNGQPPSGYAQAADGGFGRPAQAPPRQAVPPTPVAPAQATAAGWSCTACGHAGNTGKFCAECGAPNAALEGWTCTACGHAGNTGKFCIECGAPRPAGAPVYKCDKCGWEPEDPKNPPKFCPECGDVFDENDTKL
jgi:membrane protease subunit (stomatin/prohibitin family)